MVKARPPIARFGLVGDVHAEDEALAATLRHLKGEGLDLILCVGDVADGYGDVDRCRKLLHENTVETVRGNHDRWFLEGSLRGLPEATLEVGEATREWLAALPTTREYQTPLGPLLLCHGIAEDDMVFLTPDLEGYGLETALDALRDFPPFKLVVSGHTHQCMVRQIGETVFLNPGTLHRDCTPCFMLVDILSMAVEVHELRGHHDPVLIDRIPIPGAEPTM
jgi:putative phosphoesterase